MYQKNEYILHRIYGVLCVEDYEQMEFDGNKIDYYVLFSPFSQNKTAKIKIPIENSKLLSPFPNGKEVEELLHKVKTINANWISESKKRIKIYETVFYEATIPEIWSYLKALKEHKDIVKLTIKDRDFMRRAEQIIYGLFSIALNMDYNDVGDLLLSKEKN
jgi:RNA polymerase-interacting CarD/CdnL/TRCF family regulator